MLATDLAPRDSAAPVRPRARAGRPVLAERRRTGRLDHHQRPFHRKPLPGRCECTTPAATSSSRRSGSGATFSAGLGRPGRWRSGPRRHLHGERVSGVDGWDNAPANATCFRSQVDTAGSGAGGAVPPAPTRPSGSPRTATASRTRSQSAAKNAETGNAHRPRSTTPTVPVKKWSVENGSTRRGADLERADHAPAATHRTDLHDPCRSAGPSPATSARVSIARSSSSPRCARSPRARTIFFPQDGDGLARSTTLSFTLARPMTVTWTDPATPRARRSPPT